MNSSLIYIQHQEVEKRETGMQGQIAPCLCWGILPADHWILHLPSDLKQTNR